MSNAKNGSGMLLLFLALAWGFRRPQATTPWVALPSTSPEKLGWWWYWFPSEVNRAYAVWDKAERNKKVRKTIGGGPSLGATVVVFQVTGTDFTWTLPGLPERAPRGIDTDLTDVAGVIPTPPSALRQMAETVTKKTWEYLREIWQGRRPPREKLPF
jgi:hypothetical protein